MSMSGGRTSTIKQEKAGGSDIHPTAADRAEDEKKTKKQLMDELVDLRRRINALEPRANIELQETKRYLTRLIESSTEAIISTDKEGNVALFNKGAEALLGYREQEVIGRRATVLYGSDARAMDLVRETRKCGGSVSGFETVLLAKDGGSIPVLMSASVLCDEAGREVGMVGFATDLRKRKREEEELQKARDELEKRVGNVPLN